MAKDITECFVCDLPLTVIYNDSSVDAGEVVQSAKILTSTN